jgi:hypothetical protein
MNKSPYYKTSPSFVSFKNSLKQLEIGIPNSIPQSTVKLLANSIEHFDSTFLLNGVTISNR